LFQLLQYQTGGRTVTLITSDRADGGLQAMSELLLRFPERLFFFAKNLLFPFIRRHALGIVGERFRQDFDSDVAAELGVVSAIHHDISPRTLDPNSLRCNLVYRVGTIWVKNGAVVIVSGERCTALPTQNPTQ